MKSNLFFKILVSAYSISIFSEGILMPIYAIFVQEIGGDILDASGAIAVFLIVSGVATVIIHRFKWSQKNQTKLLVFGWLIWTVGIAGYFFVSNPMGLFLVQIFLALGNAIADPVFDAELDYNINEKDEAYKWGMFEGFQSIFSGIAALLGGFIAITFGFKVLILAMLGAATVSFVLILFYARGRKLLTGI